MLEGACTEPVQATLHKSLAIHGLKPDMCCKLVWSVYRLAKVQEARDKLQQDLSRQLANSEAKVAALQTAAQKGEEKAASLELQLSAKATPVSGQMLLVPLPNNTLPDHALLCT